MYKNGGKGEKSSCCWIIRCGQLIPQQEGDLSATQLVGGATVAAVVRRIINLSSV